MNTAQPNSGNELTTSADQYKVLGMSILHISAEDIKALTLLGNDQNMNMVAPRRTGFFIKLYDDINTQYEGISESLIELLKKVREAGYRLIEVDTDAQVYETLEIYEE